LWVFSKAVPQAEVSQMIGPQSVVWVLSEIELSWGKRKYLEGPLAALAAFKVTLGFCELPGFMGPLKSMEVLPSRYLLHSTSKARISAWLFLQRGSVEILIVKQP